MTANLLTLNSFKTEFLLIELKNQLAKIDSSLLDTFQAPTLLEILVLSWTNILPSVTKLQLSPKPVTITLVNFTVSSLTLFLQLPVGLPLLPLSFTPNLTTVILSSVNSLSLNCPVSNRLRTLLHACMVVKASKSSCHITPIFSPLAEHHRTH